MSEPAPSPEPLGAVMVVGWPIDPATLAALCRDIEARLERQPPGVVLCDVSALTGADLAAVEALCRLQIVARRHGGEIQVTNACERLVELFRLCGLGGVIRSRSRP